MKKIFFLFLIVTLVSASITSCMEEEVKPQAENVTGGGGPIKE
jgi:hypothetical protein